MTSNDIEGEPSQLVQQLLARAKRRSEMMTDPILALRSARSSAGRLFASLTYPNVRMGVRSGADGWALLSVHFQIVDS
jgi:hypothetical protein